jgi:hypothetical protein
LCFFEDNEAWHRLLLRAAAALPISAWRGSCGADGDVCIVGISALLGRLRLILEQTEAHGLFAWHLPLLTGPELVDNLGSVSVQEHIVGHLFLQGVGSGEGNNPPLPD